MKTDNKAHRSNITAILAAAFSFVGMGLIWAAGWTLVGMLGVVIFYTLFPSVPDVFDIWIPVFAYPGFFGGVIFSVVLRVAEGRRRYDELPLSRIAAWGAVPGLLLGVLLLVLAIPSNRFPLWLLVAVIIASTTLLSIVSAVASALLFRRFARQRPLLEAGLED
jgi:hypothetical protein